MSSDQLSKQALRQREYRERQKRGLKCVTVEISWDHLDALNDSGLCAWNERDQKAIQKAAQEAIDRYCEVLIQKTSA